MATLLQVAQLFDKPYERFRLDVLGSDTSVRVRLWFYAVSSSEATLAEATKAVVKNFGHQVRPFGSCKFSTDCHEFGSVEIVIREDRASDYTVKHLMERLLVLADQVAVEYNLNG